jgi:nucleotide-binding universal stress UspA family protein
MTVPTYRVVGSGTTALYDLRSRKNAIISRVFVPMDDSKMAVRALEYALKAHPDAEITVLHIVGEPSAMMGKAVGLALEDDIEEAAKEHAAKNI